MSRLPREFLRHIRDEARYLLDDSKTVDEEAFMRDETRKRAYARSFEIIGEASKQVDAGVKERFPDVEWKAMARMRDRLIHHYFGVDYGLVWSTVKNDISRLYQEVENALKMLESESHDESA
jgi:uncharacterized protein with HEPN domain